jgi:hypothetical protein
MDRKKLEGVIKLLSAQDEESVVLGIATLEACHTDTTIVSTLLAIKESKVNKFLLERTAPDFYKQLSDLCLRPDLNPTYKRINDILMGKKQEDSQAELFIEYLSKDLTNTYKQLGYTFIDKINVVMKETEDAVE